MKKKGMIIIVSAPSGAGKTSICDALIKSDNNIVYSVSTTTREPRKGERTVENTFLLTTVNLKRWLKQICL